MPRCLRRILRLIPLVVLTGLAVFLPLDPVRADDTAATYRCWMFNVEGGGGGYCRTSAPIILYEDGTYKESTTRGKYTVKGNQIVFSKSTVRGPGLIKDNKIIFRYVYDGQRQTTTYLLESGRPPTASTASAADTSPSAGSKQATGKRITVDVTVRFPAGDGTMSWADTMILTPEGERPEPASKYPMKIAVQDRKNSRIHSSFTAIPAGRVYDVWTDTGMQKRRVGQIDLRNATEDAAFTIDAVSSKGNPGSTVERPQSHTPLPPSSGWTRPKVQ